MHFLCPAAACEETSDGEISTSALGDLPTESSVRQSREAGIVAKGPQSAVGAQGGRGMWDEGGYRGGPAGEAVSPLRSEGQI